MNRKSNDLSNDRRAANAGTQHTCPQTCLFDGGVHDHGRRDNVTFTQTAPDALLPPGQRRR